MCLTNNFFEKYLNAAQDEVLQSIEIIIEKMYSKLRGSAGSSATLCIVSVIYLHWIWKIFYLPHIIFALLMLIFMSWGNKIWVFFSLNLGVKRKENTKISALTECGYLLGGGDSLTVAPVRVLVRHAHCRLQGVHITVSAMIQGVYRVCGLTGGRVCTELPRGVARPGPVALHRHHAATGRTLGTPARQQSYSWWQMWDLAMKWKARD